MDREAIKKLRSDPILMAVFDASLLTVYEDGATLQYIADLIGFPKSTVHDWLRKARDRRKTNDLIRRGKHRNARVIMAACIENGCTHKLPLGPGLEICLDCGRVSPALKFQLKWDRDPEVVAPPKFRPRGAR